MKVDEAALVREILQGDTEAFRIIVERHQTRVFYLGLKFLKDREEAEDFAQEVFLRAFERLDTYKGEGAFAGWLYRVAFNLASSKYRQTRKVLTESWDDERDALADDGAQRGVVEGTGSRMEEVERKAIHAESIDEVNQALKKIPGPYAVLVKMHYYDGLSYPEISEILSMPINTIKSYMHRAKKSIRKLLTGRGYAEAK